jgi:hypothetical protein
MQLQVLHAEDKVNLCYDRRSVGKSLLEQSTHLGLKTKSLLLSESSKFVDAGRSLWRIETMEAVSAIRPG